MQRATQTPQKLLCVLHGLVCSNAKMSSAHAKKKSILSATSTAHACGHTHIISYTYTVEHLNNRDIGSTDLDLYWEVASISVVD